MDTSRACRGLGAFASRSAVPTRKLVAECKRTLEAVLPNRVCLQRVSRDSGVVVVAVHSNALGRLFPQHGSGPKHLRPIFLADWQRQITRAHPESLLRGLIHSDGCRSLNTVRSSKGKRYSYPRYQFNSHSDDIRAIFCEHLDLLGIPWTRMNRWNIFGRATRARLDEFVGPKR